MTVSPYSIPRTHDEPAKLLLWDFDQAMLFMIAVVFGILSEMLLLGFGLGLFGARWYGQRKVGRHRMFVVHLMYWFLPSEWIFPTPSLPPSCTREFIG